MEENNLETIHTEPTYINPNGEDCSVIDYIMFSRSIANKISTVTRLDSLSGNVSDHYPVHCKTEYIPKRVSVNTDNQMMKSSRIKWDKLDRYIYSVQLNKSLNNINCNIKSKAGLETAVNKLNEILKSSAEAAVPRKSTAYPKS